MRDDLNTDLKKGLSNGSTHESSKQPESIIFIKIILFYYFLKKILFLIWPVKLDLIILIRLLKILLT
jgi:hypothetical protein